MIKYHKTPPSRHSADLSAVLSRAREAGVERLLVTGGSLEESRAALQLAREHPDQLWCTVGCHPTRCGQFEAEGVRPEEYYHQLLALAQAGEP